MNAAAVARIGAHRWPVRLTPTMQVLLASIGEIAGVEATPENAEALVEEFGDADRLAGLWEAREGSGAMRQREAYAANGVPGVTRLVADAFLPE